MNSDVCEIFVNCDVTCDWLCWMMYYLGLYVGWIEILCDTRWTTRFIWAQVWWFDCLGGCYYTCALINWMVLLQHAHPCASPRCGVLSKLLFFAFFPHYWKARFCSIYSMFRDFANPSWESSRAYLDVPPCNFWCGCIGQIKRFQGSNVGWLL